MVVVERYPHRAFGKPARTRQDVRASPPWPGWCRRPCPGCPGPATARWIFGGVGVVSVVGRGAVDVGRGGGLVVVVDVGVDDGDVVGTEVPVLTPGTVGPATEVPGPSERATCLPTVTPANRRRTTTRSPPTTRTARLTTRWMWVPGTTCVRPQLWPPGALERTGCPVAPGVDDVSGDARPIELRHLLPQEVALDLR